MAHGKRIALLRGINVGGHNRIQMAELRALCAEVGLEDTESHIQSGNLVFSSAARPAALEPLLERAIEDRFGLSIPVLVRAAADWAKYVKENPFAEASEKEPKLVMLHLSKAPPKRSALKEIRERAGAKEVVAFAGAALWIHYGGGVARSKLTPAFLDRVVGSTVTARNWRTVLQLAEMAGA